MLKKSFFFLVKWAKKMFMLIEIDTEKFCPLQKKPYNCSELELEKFQFGYEPNLIFPANSPIH